MPRRKLHRSKNRQETRSSPTLETVAGQGDGSLVTGGYGDLKRRCCSEFSRMFHQRYTACYPRLWCNRNQFSVRTPLYGCVALERALFGKTRTLQSWELGTTFPCRFDERRSS